MEMYRYLRSAERRLYGRLWRLDTACIDGWSTYTPACALFCITRRRLLSCAGLLRAAHEDRNARNRNLS